MPCRTEHRRIAPRRPAKAVGGRVIQPIGFGLDDHPARATNVEPGSDQTPRQIHGAETGDFALEGTGGHRDDALTGGASDGTGRRELLT